MRLDAVRGFIFDIDGTLVHRTGPEEVHAIPGARELLDRIVGSGRPFAVFTNGSHLAPNAFAHQLRTAGLPVADGQVLTPLCSVQGYLIDGCDVVRAIQSCVQNTRVSGDGARFS